MADECPFCKIISGDLPANIVYKDDQVIAFNDNHPKAPKHILIIPREHIPSLNDLKPDQEKLIGHLIMAAKKIAADKKIAESGYRIIMNCNANAGQVVFHIHMHLLGGKHLNWSPA